MHFHTGLKRQGGVQYHRVVVLKAYDATTSTGSRSRRVIECGDTISTLPRVTTGEILGILSRSQVDVMRLHLSNTDLEHLSLSRQLCLESSVMVNRMLCSHKVHINMCTTPCMVSGDSNM